MSRHANVIWYMCDKCKRPVMWVYRVAHRWHCKDGKEGEGQFWSK